MKPSAMPTRSSRLPLFIPKDRTHIYEWINGAPLNDNKKTVMVNYFEYWIMDRGKIVYHNSWVTDFPVDDDNVEKMVRIM